MYAKKNSSKKMIAILLAVALLVGGAVGGTVAWLITGTKTVTNTFTVGNINIDLTETVNGKAESALTADVANTGFKIVPGTSQTKDPTITVKAGSEDCFVFVKIEESNNATPNGVAYVTWDIADGWTKLEDGVYYREYTKSNANVTYPILLDDQVSYSSNLTKAQLDELGANKPALAFTAYAVQKANGNSSFFTPAAAWEEIE